MWDRIEGDRSVVRHRVRHEWARLTGEHLDPIDGRRDPLARGARGAYGDSDDEAEQQVAAWACPGTRAAAAIPGRWARPSRTRGGRAATAI